MNAPIPLPPHVRTLLSSVAESDPRTVARAHATVAREDVAAGLRPYSRRDELRAQSGAWLDVYLVELSARLPADVMRQVLGMEGS
jgi:hypothetical protein